MEDERNRPDIIAAARAVLLAMTPASNEQRAAIIWRALNAYDSFVRRSEDDKVGLIQDWNEDLSIYPVDMLKAMARRWRMSDTKGFTPTIGQFIDCLPAEMADRFSALYKARRVSEQEWFA